MKFRLTIQKRGGEFFRGLTLNVQDEVEAQALGEVVHNFYAKRSLDTGYAADVTIEDFVLKALTEEDDQ